MREHLSTAPPASAASHPRRREAARVRRHWLAHRKTLAAQPRGNPDTHAKRGRISACN